MYVEVAAGAVIFQRPGVSKLTKLTVNTVFLVLGTIDGWYNINYGNNGGWVASDKVIKPVPDPNPNPDPDPEPNPEIVLTHVIEVYSDGSITIDGNPV